MGSEAIERMVKAMLKTYDGGTPRTHHISSNIMIEFDENGEAASSRSYSTAVQAAGDLSHHPG